jgi:hypothetical protein
VDGRECLAVGPVFAIRVHAGQNALEFNLQMHSLVSSRDHQQAAYKRHLNALEWHSKALRTPLPQALQIRDQVPKHVSTVPISFTPSFRSN